MPPPAAIYFRVSPLIVGGWLLVLLIVGTAPHGLSSLFLIGLAAGTLFQQTVLAAAWSALGPGQLLTRMPLSIIWAALMALAWALPIMADNGWRDALVISVMMAGAWLIAQFPIWLTAKILGLQLRHQETRVTHEVKQRQFGIGQMMIFTAFVAVVLGLLRLVANNRWLGITDLEVVIIMAWLLLMQLLITLPLLFGMLLPNRWLLGTALGLLFVVLAMVAEIPIAMRVLNTAYYHDYLILPCVNAVSVAWVLLFAAVIRGSGYHFGVPSNAIEK